jgi:trk system potassium uptake protein TrkH
VLALAIENPHAHASVSAVSKKRKPVKTIARVQSLPPIQSLPPAPPPPPPDLLAPSVLIPLYVLVIVIGYKVFRSGAATVKGNDLSPQRALFAAVNAATLTGFQERTSLNEYTPAGQWLTLGLTLTGIWFSFIAGGMAVVRIARLGFSDARIVLWSLGTTALVAFIGGPMLLGDGRGLFAATFDALSAFGNSGLYAGRLLGDGAWQSHLVLLPLALIGGLGLPVIMELWERSRGRGGEGLSPHTQSVLAWTAGVYIVAALLLLALQWPDNSFIAWRHTLATVSREVINARSAGFPFDFATYWPRVVQWVTIGLMIIGAAPAGTGGGVKVTTLGVITAGTRDALRDRSAGRLFGIALVWLAVYILMLGVALLVLLTTEPQMPGDRLLFLAASALGNVGISHDPIALSQAGWYALSATMLAGRVAPVLMLWWVVDTAPSAEIAVG